MIASGPTNERMTCCGPDDDSSIVREFPEEAAMFRHRRGSNPNVTYTSDGRRMVNGKLIAPSEDAEQMWNGLLKRTISKKITTTCREPNKKSVESGPEPDGTNTNAPQCSSSSCSASTCDDHDKREPREQPSHCVENASEKCDSTEKTCDRF